MNLSKLLLATTFVLTSVMAMAQTINISGRVVGLTDKNKVVIQNIIGDTLSVSPINNNSFSIDLKEGVSIYTISIGVYSNTLYIDKDVKIGGFIDLLNPKSSKISFKGTENNNVLAQIISGVKGEIDRKKSRLSNIMSDKSQSQDAINKAQGESSDEFLESRIALEELKAIKDPNMAASLAYLYRGKYYDVAKMLNDQLSQEAKDSYTGNLLARFMDSKSSLRIGHKAPAFEIVDINGKIRSLKSFKGKIIVLDFWASWCGPCRSEMIHLRDVYKDLNKGKVEFISICLDDTEELWKEAHKEEDIKWVSLWAGAWKTSELRAVYQFYSIPHIIVIDKKGRFQGSGYRRTALNEKLNELLK